MTILKNQVVESLSHGPQAVVHHEDFGAIFVTDTCPGDVIDLEVYDKRKGFAFAKPLMINQESAARNQDPKCKLHKVCGGCQWQHIDYAQQLQHKRLNIIDLMKKSGIKKLADRQLSELNHIDLIEDLENIPEVLGMEDPWHFRNKIIYPVDTVNSTGRVVAGYYEYGSHNLVNIKYCPIQYSVFDNIMERVKSLCADHGVRKPLLRHVMMRANHDQSEVIVMFVIRKKELRHSSNLALGTIAAQLQSEFDEVKVIALNYNDMSTNTIYGKKTDLLFAKNDYDDGSITETLDDTQFKVSATSFFQVNNKQFSKILSTLKDFIQDSLAPGAHLLDAYCGTGSISISLAKALPEMQITGIDIVEESIKNAQVNAELNGLENCTWIADAIEKRLEEIQDLKPEMVILNPPRKGCNKKVIETIASLELEKIAYVSCNPATLFRDVAIFEEYGYKLSKYQAVDLFPHSFHVESVALLERI